MATAQSTKPKDEQVSEREAELERKAQALAEREAELEEREAQVGVERGEAAETWETPKGEVWTWEIPIVHAYGCPETRREAFETKGPHPKRADVIRTIRVLRCVDCAEQTSQTVKTTYIEE